MLKIDLQRFAENEEVEETTVDPGSGTGGTETDPENKNDGENKTVTMTQAQIDDLINKAFAKGARKAKGSHKDQIDKSGTVDNQSEEADKKLQRANEIMLEGTIKSVAPEANISARGAKVAAKMYDFTDCFDKDGNLDESAVKENIEDFLKEYPEFAVKAKEDAGSNKGFVPKVGAGGKDDRGTENEDDLYAAFRINKK